ncbi:MAG: alpha-2-macroglobulin family protein [Elusimicrobiota bacterium]
MRLFLPALLLLFSCLRNASAGLSGGAELARADRLFEQGRHEEALAVYEGISHGVGENAFKAFYRACESEALLMRTGAALERSRRAAQPEDPLSRLRLRLLKTELALAFLHQEGEGLPADEIAGATETFKRTAQQWRKEIDDGYRSLWFSRKGMAGRRVEQESYFLDADHADSARYPTLLDVYADRFSQWVLGDAGIPAGNPRPDPLIFLKTDFTADLFPGAPAAVQAAAIYEEAFRLDGEGRGRASEEWRIERLMIPFRRPDLVAAFKDPAAAQDTAAAVLLRWRKESRSPEARARAGYEAAVLIDGRGRRDEAVQLCGEIQSSAPRLASAQGCAQLCAEIRRPELMLGARTVPPPGKAALHVRSRNLSTVFLRLYAFSPEKASASGASREMGGWSAVLNGIDEAVLRKVLSEEKPLKAWSIPAKPARPYTESENDAEVPEAGIGLYLAVACSDASCQAGSSLVSAAVLDVTNALLVGSSGLSIPSSDLLERTKGPSEITADAFWLYAFDGRNGTPLPEAELDVFLGRDDRTPERRSIRTDASGRAAIPVSLDLRRREARTNWADPLLRHPKGTAFLRAPLTLDSSAPQRLRLFLETDRPAYRPGQSVRWRAVCVERGGAGFLAYNRAPVRVRLIDAAGQEADSSSLRPGAFGAAAGSFVLPMGRPLGRWSLQASLEDGRDSALADSSISVEEYRRPEFEVELSTDSSAWIFGRSGEVRGSVRYLFGGAVRSAELEYAVYREPSWEGCGRPRSCMMEGGREEVLRGRVRSDENGGFSFAFTPRLPDGEDASASSIRFLVRVEAREAGGRTICAQRSYAAGASSSLASMEPETAFLSSGRAFKVRLGIADLEGRGVPGKGEFVLSRIDKLPKAEPPSGGAEGSWESPGLSELYWNAPDAVQILRASVTFSLSGEAELRFPGVAAGLYRLELRAQDEQGGRPRRTLVLPCVDAKTGRVPQRLPGAALSEYPSYEAGQKARLLIGSAEVLGPIHVEVFAGNSLLARSALPEGGVRLFEVPVREAYRGGFTVRWFGVRDFRVHSGSVHVPVPWADKRLKLSLHHDPVLRPGQKASWSLEVLDSSGVPVQAEAGIRMFDRSLEYYVEDSAMDLESLYAQEGGPLPAQGSLYERDGIQLPVEKGWFRSLMGAFPGRVRPPAPAPGFRFGRSFSRGNMRSMMLMNDGGLAGSAAPASSEISGQARPESSRKAQGAREVDRKMDAEPIRKDFSETAFYEPQLRVRDGRADWSFQVPEQLTDWKVVATALTRDVKTGFLSARTATRKELMVRLEMPRFLREGDESQLLAVVHDQTEEPREGSLRLSIEGPQGDALALFGASGSERPLRISSGASVLSAWKVRAPSELGEFRVRVAVSAGGLSDAEERILPVLPSRERLVESRAAVLEGDSSAELSLESLRRKDTSLRQELLQLQVEPQTLLSALNAVPFLMSYPYSCVEQTLDRFLPLSMIEAVYRKSPALSRAAAALPRRATGLPAWEAEDSRRGVRLSESPWMADAQGGAELRDLADLLDPAKVLQQRQAALEGLRAAQLPDGGFPWFAGGRADPYITLLVLDGFAESQRCGVEVPEDMADRALRFISAWGGGRGRSAEEFQALSLYAAYIFSSLPERFRVLPGAARAKRSARTWLESAVRRPEALSRLGCAQAARAYAHLGEPAKSRVFLDRAMQGLVEDPVTGASWQPEKSSWRWYQDTVETHAFMLRTLQALLPEDPRISGLVRRLLFSRTGSRWRSTKDSAAAVYALLEYFQARGALEKGDDYSVKWGSLSERIQVKPEEALSKPLRWSRGTAVVPELRTPQLRKSGSGTAFASLTHVYSTDAAVEASSSGLLEVRRGYYRRMKEGVGWRLVPLKPAESVHVGDEIEVRLELSARGDLEYAHLRDPRPAGFESSDLLSGWKWDGIERYEEPRDSAMEFFLPRLPRGEYTLSYRVRPTTPGSYHAGPAVLQSLYAPEFGAHSSDFRLTVE